MSRRHFYSCCGLLTLLGTAANADPAGEPATLQMDWGELHLKTTSPTQSPPRRGSGTPAVVPAQGKLPPSTRSRPGKPRPVYLEWSEIYFQTEVQYENERQVTGSPGSVFTRSQTLVEPVMGLGVNGSVYHPNLMQFHLDTELGLTWQDTQVDPGGSASDGKFLQRYHGTVDFLTQKPFATSFFASKEMTYREYDFFSRFRVDSESYGGRTGYAAGPVPFSISAQHYQEVLDNPQRPMEYRQDTVSFQAQNGRGLFDGNTRLAYNVNDFTRRDDGFSTTHGLAQNLNLTDNEVFGAQKQVRLASLFNYSSLTQTEFPTDLLMAQENLRLQHSPKLDSYYTYSFNTSTAGESEATTHAANAGVNYEFQPDLNAGLDAQGNTAHSAATGSSLETESLGGGLSAQYTPTLSTWSRLAVSDAGHFDHEDRKASGYNQFIPDEVITLNNFDYAILSQPEVLPSTIMVWDNTRPEGYAPIDYEVWTDGATTRIRRSFGSTIPATATVHVRYYAALQGSATYDTLANNASFRLDLWNGLLGLYGHWTYQTYNGGENLLLRTLDDKTIGMDSAWRWFRASAEYETVESNLSPYDQTRLTQSAHFQPGEKTDLSLNANESWANYRDTHLQQNSYGFVARLQQQLTARMAGGAEAGLRIERGATFDRDLATCRLWLDWAVGKLTVKASYEFNAANQQSDKQERHYFFVRLRRDFQ